MFPPKPSGFVLITLLLFVFAITLLVLNGFESLQLHHKLTAYQGQSMQLFYTGYRVLQEAESRLVRGDADIRDLYEHIAHASDTWWKQHAQSMDFGGINTWYYIETMSVHPCIKIQGEKVIGAKLYRITVKIKSSQPDTLLLQAIYAKAEQLTEKCQDKITTLNPGQQSWRIVNN